MAKTALGRGLRHLMGGARPAEKPERSPFAAPEPNETAVGPGLSSLLQGQRGEPPGAAPRSDKNTADRLGQSHSLTWILLAADALFVILALWLVMGRPGRPGPGEIVLGILALAFGGSLACFAFWVRR